MELITKKVEVIDNEAIGNLARKTRWSLNIPLREVARRMNYSAAYISDLELGKRNWTQKLLNDYENALKTPRKVTK